MNRMLFQGFLIVYPDHALHAYNKYAPASAEALLAYQVFLSISLYQ